MLRTLLALMGSLGAMAGGIGVTFEPEVQSLGAGKSPKFFARRAHGLMMIKTVPAGKGADLVFQSSPTWGRASRRRCG
jgi:hypothetical protein